MDAEAFLGQVESAISDLYFLASLATIHRVFRLLATRYVELLLGKLAVCEITQTKTDILTRNAHF